MLNKDVGKYPVLRLTKVKSIFLLQNHLFDKCSMEMNFLKMSLGKKA